MDGWMNRMMDGRTDRLIDAWMDGSTNKQLVINSYGRT